MNSKQYVVLSKETWNVIEALLMELPFKISSPIIQKIRDDTSIMVLNEERYETLKKEFLSSPPS